MENDILKMNDSHRYDDMLYLPHHQSDTHPHMSMRNRAAQFSPFQALSGYGDSIEEKARFTQQMMEIDENTKSILDGKLQTAMEEENGHPELTITYFQPDPYKEGGSYETFAGRVKRILENEGKILFYAEDGIHNGLSIEMKYITDIGGDIF